MKKKYLFVLNAMLAFIFSSCDKNEFFEGGEKMVKMSFSANIGTPVDSDEALSRTTIDYGTEHTWNSVSFDSEESISILPLTTATSFNYEFKNSASNKGTFTGSVTETDAAATKFIAVYPYKTTNRIQIDDSGNGYLYFDIPQNQTVKDKDISLNTSFAIFDKDVAESVPLLNKCALMRIVFKGNQANLSKIKKLRILEARGYKCAGEMKQGITGFNISGNVDYSSEGVSDINVTHVDGENKFVIGEEYYVVVRPNTGLQFNFGAYITGKPDLQYLYKEESGKSFASQQIYTYEITIP